MGKVNGYGYFANRPRDPRYSSKLWRRIRAEELARSTVCAICGHEGSGTLDHITPVELDRDGRFYDRTNLQPAHGAKSPCYVCAAAYRANGYENKGCCQEVRGSLPVDMAWERITRKTGLRWGEVPGQPYDASRALSAPSREWDAEGREW